MLKFGVPTGQEWVDALMTQKWVINLCPNFSTGQICREPLPTFHYGLFTVVFYDDRAQITDSKGDFIAWFDGKVFVSNVKDEVSFGEISEKVKMWHQFRDSKEIQRQIQQQYNEFKLKELL